MKRSSTLMLSALLAGTSLCSAEAGNYVGTDKYGNTLVNGATYFISHNRGTAASFVTQHNEKLNPQAMTGNATQTWKLTTSGTNEIKFSTPDGTQFWKVTNEKNNVGGAVQYTATESEASQFTLSSPKTNIFNILSPENHYFSNVFGGSADMGFWDKSDDAGSQFYFVPARKVSFTQEGFQIDGANISSDKYYAAEAIAKLKNTADFKDVYCSQLSYKATVDGVETASLTFNELVDLFKKAGNNISVAASYPTEPIVILKYVNPRGESIAADVTCKVKNGAIQDLPATPIIAHYTNPQPNIDPATIIEKSTIITYTYAFDYPFKTSIIADGATSWTGNEIWYSIKLRGTYCENTDKTTTKAEKTDLNLTKSMFFCLTGNANDGFKFYNMTLGPSTPISVQGISTWKCEYFPPIKGLESIIGGWCFHENGNDNYLNKQNNAWAIWSSASAKGEIGSSLEFIGANEIIKTVIQQYLNEAESGCVGSYSLADINASNLTSSTTIDEYFNASKALSEKETIPLIAGRYYHFINKAYGTATPVTPKNGKALQSNGVGNVMTAVNQNGERNQIWKIEKGSADNQYYIMSASGDSKYIQAAKQSVNVTTGPNPVDFTITKVNSNFYAFRAASSTNNYEYLHCTGTNIVGWETSANATQWYLVPDVADIVVLEPKGTIAEGSNEDVYNTYVAAQDCSIPEGLTAEIVTSASNNYATTTPITSAPKGTPMFIKGKVGSIQILPMAKATQDVSNNILKISDGNAEASNTTLIYVLAYPKTGNEAKLYNYTAGSLAAGKVYLPYEKLNSIGVASYINFGQELTTNIENAPLVTPDQNKQATYDLLGRKVSTSAKGLNIVNGQKMILK